MIKLNFSDIILVIYICVNVYEKWWNFTYKRVTTNAYFALKLLKALTFFLTMVK